VLFRGAAIEKERRLDVLAIEHVEDTPDAALVAELAVHHHAHVLLIDRVFRHLAADQTVMRRVAAEIGRPGFPAHAEQQRDARVTGPFDRLTSRRHCRLLEDQFGNAIWARWITSRHRVSSAATNFARSSGDPFGSTRPCGSMR